VGNASITPMQDPNQLQSPHTSDESNAAFMQTLFESSPDSIVVVDAAGVMVRVNARAESMFGYEREELLGKPVELLVPDHARQGHKARRDQYIEAPHMRQMGAG